MLQLLFVCMVRVISHTVHDYCFRVPKPQHLDIRFVLNRIAYTIAGAAALLCTEYCMKYFFGINSTNRNRLPRNFTRTLWLRWDAAYKLLAPSAKRVKWRQNAFCDFSSQQNNPSFHPLSGSRFSRKSNTKRELVAYR